MIFGAVVAAAVAWFAFANSRQVISQPYIRGAASESAAQFRHLGLESKAWEFGAPAATQVSIWVEAYRDGKPLWDPNHLSLAQSRNEEQIGKLHFLRQEPQEPAAGDSGKQKWAVTVETTPRSISTMPQWVDAPDEEHQFSVSPELPLPSRIEFGTPYVVQALLGAREGGSVRTSHDPTDNEFCTLVKVRFDPMGPDGPGTGPMK